jgi:hypothetical protein
MPDTLKELRDALASGASHSIARYALQRSIQSTSPGRLFGSDQPYGGGNGSQTQDFFTTGYNSGTGETTVAFLPDFSTVDGADIITA